MPTAPVGASSRCGGRIGVMACVICRLPNAPPPVQARPSPRSIPGTLLSRPGHGAARRCVCEAKCGAVHGAPCIFAQGGELRTVRCRRCLSLNCK
ncbi:hypothetical protein BRADI_2g54391v3 [Brachypodium distachyon]|uniref:Uncharacterized protein n=1 Tax=Brachypodium distachyon TaxID=15368 RepID=A0A2K2DFU7_BRADI|nr:hypothetical protein BRADI_2g54391v3 [Brachypodium distachyon]